MNFLDVFKAKTFTQRAPERQFLTVPIHEEVDNRYKEAKVQAVVAAAAAQVAGSGLVWKWVRYDGSAKLCHWDSVQRVFLQGSLTDWVLFFGRHFRVQDTGGREYLGPSPAVADRLIQRILADPTLPVASWSLQLAKKREATK
jgi:hypothetical protein